MLGLGIRLNLSDILKGVLVNNKFLLSNFFNVSNSFFNCSLFLFYRCLLNSLGNSVRLFSGFGFIDFFHVGSDVFSSFGFLGSNGNLKSSSGSSLNGFLGGIIKSFLILSNSNSLGVGDKHDYCKS